MIIATYTDRNATIQLAYDSGGIFRVREVAFEITSVETHHTFTAARDDFTERVDRTIVTAFS